MKKLILFVFVLGLHLDNSQACSCYPPRSFCHQATLSYDLIVSGELVYVDTMKAQLKIIDIFKGVEINDTITIWAGTGYECTGWMSMAINFGVAGDTIIITLPRITSSNIENAWDVEGDYRRPHWFCEETILYVRNDSVFGEINNNATDSWIITLHFREMEYLDFVALWDNGNMDCSNLIGIEENESNIPLKLFPNPATEKISIELPPNSGEVSSVVISDIAGNVVASPLTPLQGERGTVNVSTLSPGIYFVLAETDKFVFRQKLIKQ